MQHSNEILTTIMSSYHNIRARSYRIETPAGYWFNATFEPAISAENTFDNMSDDERIIKHTMTISVPAYIILPSSPGMPNGLRRTLSATQFSFGFFDGVNAVNPAGNVDDMRIDSRLLDNVSTIDDPRITEAIGYRADSQAETAAGGIQGNASLINPLTTAVGGTESSSIMVTSTSRKLTEDPMTGKPMDAMVRVRNVASVHGEQILTNLTKVFKSDKDLK
jgi:hypothetical protein